MKQFTLLFVLLLSIGSYAQRKASSSLYLRLEDSYQMPLAFTTIWITEKETGTKTKHTSDKVGLIRHYAKQEMSYGISFDSSVEHTEITIPKSYTYLRKTIVYDPPGHRNTSAPDTIMQFLPPSQQANDTASLVKFQLVDKKMNRLKGISVSIYSRSQNKVYATRSDKMGQFRFLAPIGQYVISIDDLMSFQEISIEKSDDGFVYTKILIFIPTDVDETEQNDTIRQRIPSYYNPSSSRVALRIYAKNHEGEMLDNEKVYINALRSQKVYVSTTDSKGEARFLIPKSERYVVHFEYERDMDLFEFHSSNTLFSARYGYRYLGTENIKEFYKTSHRDKNGFLTQFRTSSIKSISISNDIIEKTTLGYNLNFNSQSSVAAPMAIDGHLLVSGGYYTSTFYSFEPETGHNQWGVQLADGGPSAAAYADGMVLLITQSCTLYALDAQSGSLAWSKWLGPNLYSSPSVANGKVFAVYPSELTYSLHGKNTKFVLIAFDLQTGDILWQARTDADVLAAPVVTDKHVFMTSMTGTVYQFDESTGEQIAENKIDATSPPTVAAGNVFVSARNVSDKTKQEIVVLKQNSLDLVRRSNKIKGNVAFTRPHNLSTDKLMSYNGARTTHYKGRNYQVMNNKLYCSNPATGNLYWIKTLSNTIPSKEISSALASMPVVFKNKVMVATTSGKILIYHAISGKLIRQYSTGSKLSFQPIVYNGWIYVSSDDGKVISINTKKPTEYTGWGMWNANGNHNPAIE